MAGFMNIIRHSLSPLPAAVAQLGRSVSFDVFGGFPGEHSTESPAPFRFGSAVDADIECYGWGSTLGFPGRGEWDQDGTDWSVGLRDQFSADDRHGFDFREDQMKISEDRIPNKALERTAAERLGFDMAGFMNIIGHSVSPFPAAVAQLGR